MSHQPRRGQASPARPNVRYTSSPPPALLSHSTITFLASWRGQLLVCTSVLILGGIYFFVRDPISQWSRRRQEVISKLRENELIKMETQEKSRVKTRSGVDDGDKEELGSNLNKVGARERGREKRKEGKKRGGSILRVAADNTEYGTGPSVSSIESSPAPTSLPRARSISAASSSPVKQKKNLPTPTSGAITIASSPSIKVRRPTDEVTSSPSTAKRTSETPARCRAPPPIIVPKPITVTSHTSADPWNIPLPLSPEAGPSRLNGHSLPNIDIHDVSGVSDDASESAQSCRPEEGRVQKKSDGFSIFPDDGYLPVLTPSTGSSTSSSKKKKRKNRSASSTTPSSQVVLGNGTPSILPNDDHGSLNPGDNEHEDEQVIYASRPRHRHTRTSSIALLPDLTTGQLREIVEKRDETIDSLRGEIGVAKAEESKALEEVRRARANEERMRSDLDRARRAGGNGEGDARRREAELQSRMSQLHQAYTSALARLGSYESVLRETGHGHMLPPPPSPIPFLVPQSSPLPGIPSSPYAPSTGRGTPMGGYIPYPSPGMYPSPMLVASSHYSGPGQGPVPVPVSIPHPHPHSHSHSHSPSPYRRSSGVSIYRGQGHEQGFMGIPMSGEDAGLAGPLTPGLTGHPMYISSSTMPIGLGHPVTGNGDVNGSGSEERERRRQSIESSVLKRKVKDLSSLEASKDNDRLTEEAQQQEQRSENGRDGADNKLNGGYKGSGGSVIDSGSASNSGSRSSAISISAESASASVSNSRSNSPTPDGERKSSTLNGDAAAAPLHSANGFTRYKDGENGNVYYPEYVESALRDTSNGDSGVEGNASLASSEQESTAFRGASSHSEGISRVDDDNNKDYEQYSSEPIFASLAHTPAQVEEMKRMRDQVRTQPQVHAKAHASDQRSTDDGAANGIETGRSASISSGSLSVSGSAASAGGRYDDVVDADAKRRGGAGYGNGGLLTPSPCKSPVLLTE